MHAHLVSNDATSILVIILYILTTDVASTLVIILILKANSLIRNIENFLKYNC